MSQPDAIERYLVNHRGDALQRLCTFLSIPSISALSEHKPDIARAAVWLADEMQRVGLERVEVVPTAGHPIVYGEWLGAPGRPTALIYGHYDVQPVDPLELWESPPFGPIERDGRLYARGASDDKGQVYMHLAALEALMATEGALPLNVKVLVEGEEENGSANLERFVEENRVRLAADVLVISDTTMVGPGAPAICTGLRGIAALEIDLRTAKGDLHSGLFGGAVPNALHEMVALLGALREPDGRIAVPGFYDAVNPLSPAEREAIGRLADPEAFQATAGVSGTPGEAGFSPLERIWARPTLELNGLWGGFTGEGSKTVVPCEAHAKVTCRLVPDQDPDRIIDLIEARLRAVCPPYAMMQVVRGHVAEPWRCDPSLPALEAAATALKAAYGTEPVRVRMGGSIPVVGTFDRVLGLPIVLMGFGLSEENFHAPNEFLTLDNFDKGLRAITRYWLELGRRP